MLSLRETNTLMATSHMSINKQTIIMDIHRDGQLPFFPVLTTNASFTSGHSIGNYYKSLPNYIVRLEWMLYLTHTLHVPNRIVNLDLELSNVMCVNTPFYKLNKVKKQVKGCSKRLLIINVLWTKVYRLPKGFFMSIITGNSQYTRQPICRESIVNLNDWRGLVTRFTYVPRSLIDLTGFEYPESRQFIDYGILSTAIYNTHYKVTKELIIDSLRPSYFIYRVVKLNNECQ